MESDARNRWAKGVTMGNAHHPPQRRTGWGRRLLGKLRAALLASVTVVGAFVGIHPVKASVGDAGTVIGASVAVKGVWTIFGSATQTLSKGVVSGLGSAIGGRMAPYFIAAWNPILRPFDRLVVVVPTSSVDGQPAGATPTEFRLVGGSDIRMAHRLQGWAARAHVKVSPYEVEGIYQRLGGAGRYRVHSTLDPQGGVLQLWSPTDLAVWQADMETWGSPSTFEGTFSDDGMTLGGYMSVTLHGSLNNPVEFRATFGYSADHLTGDVAVKPAQTTVDPGRS